MREGTGLLNAVLNTPPTTVTMGRIVGYRKPPWWKFWAKPKPIREVLIPYANR